MSLLLHYSGLQLISVALRDYAAAQIQAVTTSFKDRRARAIFEGRHPGKGFPPDLIRPARRKWRRLPKLER